MLFSLVAANRSAIALAMWWTQQAGKAKKHSAIRLKIAIHLDAVRHAPRAYIVALWWHLRRKRVRARHQFAALFGCSPRAYDLWLLNERVSPDARRSVDAEQLRIMALIDTRGATDAELGETMQSVAEQGLPALLIGTADIPTIAVAARQIDWRAGPWLMPIAAGDTLASGASAAYRAATAQMSGTMAQLIYGDDDLLDETGRRGAPHFKPDWNAELFRHFDYITGACILLSSREHLETLGDAVDWPRRLTEHVLENGATPVHACKILHHRRARPQPSAPPAVARSEQTLPLTTIIVPTRNRRDLLETCLAGLAATNYAAIDVIVVDNGSDDPATLSYLAGLDPARYRVLRHAGPFNFSAINNRAVQEARGELLCMLNNDIEIVEPNWLQTMAVQALRCDVGAVGARLLYPDGRIQHAGVVLGVGGAAAHAHRLLRPDDTGYFRRHSLPQFVSAVTAACLVVSRARFLAVGGLDESCFPVAFNDVDLCLRLNGRGWQSLYEPRATLIHHESVSRGLDRDPVGAARFAGELAALKQRWGTGEIVDPFHHPELSRASEQFVMGLV